MLRDFAANTLPPWFAALQRRGVLPSPWKDGTHVSLREASSKGFARIIETSPAQEPLAEFVLAARDEASQDYIHRFRDFDDSVAEPLSYGVYDASDVKVWPQFGVHTTTHGSLSDVYCNRAALANPKYELPRLALPFMPVEREYEIGVFLGPAWYHNHYHWLGDILTRLDLVRDELGNGIPLIVPPILRPVQRVALLNALRAAGAPDVALIQPKERVVRFKKLHMPTQMARPLNITARQLRFLRQAMLQQPSGSGETLRLYVSRGDAAIRRIENEREVEQRLHRLGFQTVKLSCLPFEQQVELFAKAECVVGHHGAGHANVAFCPPGAKVIEVFQAGHFSPRFARMSQIGGLQYGYCVGEPSGRDTIANIEALDELLERLAIS